MAAMSEPPLQIEKPIWVGYAVPPQKPDGSPNSKTHILVASCGLLRKIFPPDLKLRYDIEAWLKGGTEKMTGLGFPEEQEVLNKFAQKNPTSFQFSSVPAAVNIDEILYPQEHYKRGFPERSFWVGYDVGAPIPQERATCLGGTPCYYTTVSFEDVRLEIIKMQFTKDGQCFQKRGVCPLRSLVTPFEEELEKFAERYGLIEIMRDKQPVG